MKRARTLAIVAAAFAALWIASAGSGEDAPKAPAAGAYEVRWKGREFKPQSTSCYNCHETLSRKLGRPAREHITSAHYRASVTCNECHGGDPTSDDHDAAHDEKKGFIGKPDKKLMDERCGACHEHEVKTFMASKHFEGRDDVREINCVTCHSAHQIGARDPDFSWPKTCAECHELDKMPKLPPALVSMLASKDSVVAGMRALRRKLDDKPYPPEAMEPYREVRQLSADIIHATNAKASAERLAQIEAKNKALEKALAGLAPQ